MFAYASTLGIARTLSRPPAIDKDNPLRVFFKLGVEVIDQQKYNWTFFEQKFSAVYDERLSEIPCEEEVMLTGYFQSWKYFHNIEKTIRNEFTFHDSIQHSAVAFLRRALLQSYSNLTRQDVVLVGVHVRRADMTSYENRQMGYTVASRQYLRSAMSYFEGMYNRIVFIICSDDLFWVEQNVKSEFPVVYSDNYHAVVDLAILSLCDHVIMTVGSFGWWGAYLAGGTTVYMSDFPRKHSNMATQYNKRDYFYPGWKGLPNT